MESKAIITCLYIELHDIETQELPLSNLVSRLLPPHTIIQRMTFDLPEGEKWTLGTRLPLSRLEPDHLVCRLLLHLLSVHSTVHCMPLIM